LATPVAQMQLDDGTPVRIRRRHDWVAWIGVPLTDKEADALTLNSQIAIRRKWAEDGMKMSAAACEHCEQLLGDGESWSCPGRPPE
jgi:hypothetical protein